MIPNRKYALLLAPLLLAACATEPATEEVVLDDTNPADLCDSASYQQYVGERSPAITLPPGTVFRHYRTGDPLTMDLRQDRLNFEYDRSGTLVKVSCG